MHPIYTGRRTPVAPTASNGLTAIPFGPAAVAHQIVYVAGLVFYNSDTVAHTVQLLSSGGTVLAEIPLAQSGGGFAMDGGVNRFESEPGESLQIKLKDAGGAVVFVSGSVVQK